MASQLEVAVVNAEGWSVEEDAAGQTYRTTTRLHALAGQPFCNSEIRIADDIYVRAPARFASEIVVTVLEDLGIEIASARQKIGISYATLGTAEVLGIPVNSAVFRVHRSFYDAGGKVIYSAVLTYPGDRLDLDIEFTLGAGGS